MTTMTTTTTTDDDDEDENGAVVVDCLSLEDIIARVGITTMTGDVGLGLGLDRHTTIN